MSKTASINIRTSEEIKRNSESVLKHLGLTMTGAINLFLKQVIYYRGIPFELRIPNKETLQAIDDIEKNRNLTSYDSVDEMYEDLGINNK